DSSVTRYIATDELHKIPKSPVALIKSPLLTNKSITPIIKEVKGLGKVELDDISIYDFFCPRLGEEITNTFLAAAINGIYAGDIKQLSLRSCFPKIWDIAQNNNSLIRATISRLKNGRKNKSQI